MFPVLRLMLLSSFRSSQTKHKSSFKNFFIHFTHFLMQYLMICEALSLRICSDSFFGLLIHLLNLRIFNLDIFLYQNYGLKIRLAGLIDRLIFFVPCRKFIWGLFFDTYWS